MAHPVDQLQQAIERVPMRLPRGLANKSLRSYAAVHPATIEGWDSAQPRTVIIVG
jgi:hypothetical protein